MTSRELAPARSAAPHETVAYGRRSLAPGLLLVTASAVLVLAVLLTRQAPSRAPAGLPDAGPFTAWAVMLARTLMRMSAVGVVGCLVAAVWLVPQDRPRRAMSPVQRRLLRAAGRWAAGWTITSMLLMISGSAMLLGLPLRQGLTSPAAWAYVPQLAEGRALMATAPAVFAIAVHAGGLRSRRGMHLLTAVALLALAPMALTGHAATAGDHYVATQSVVLHVLAVTVWVGGLVGLLHLRVTAGSTLTEAVRRFSPLALGCFVVVGLSGLASASTRLGVDVEGWRSAYGALVVAKVGVLVALGLVGWIHRRRTMPALSAGRPSAFWRVVGVELLIMSAAMGLAVALARTPPPVRSGVVAVPHPAGRTVDLGLQAPSPLRLVLEWRPDALVVTVVGVATLVYVVAHGPADGRDRDAVRRLLWVLAGAGLLVWSLCGGPAAYGSAVLSGHVAQFVLCAVVVPRLLAPAVSRPPLSIDPLTAAALLALLFSVVYATPLLDLALEDGGAHRVVDLVALAVGTAGVWGAGAATGPDSRARARLDRLVGLVLAVFGLGLLLTARPLALEWFSGLGWDWSDPVTDQRYAAALLLLTAVMLAASGSWRDRAPAS